MLSANYIFNREWACGKSSSTPKGINRFFNALKEWPCVNKKKMAWKGTSCAPMFFDFMNRVINQLQQSGRTKTAENYVTSFNSFYQFCYFRDIPFSAVTPDRVKQFEGWLASRNLSRNTASVYMRSLRAVYNRAVSEGLAVQARPFKNVYTGMARTSKRAISHKEIRLIKQLKLPEESSCAFARDMFLLSFYLRGISFIDLAYLRKTDIADGVLTYRRRKTGQTLSIGWEKCMQEIVNRYPTATDSLYLLPIINAAKGDIYQQYRNMERRINRHLNIIGRLCGIKQRLTMYVSRHSWASIANSRRIPVKVISECMGHRSELTTSIYIASLNRNTIDEANRKVIAGL